MILSLMHRQQFLLLPANSTMHEKATNGAAFDELDRCRLEVV
jgi:hypothetical protein